ncbi:MAG: M28 family metallopeptidase, partial [Anaerolineae bacterium]|nr:M28 family metallopeptidase [Anaerolineae bacterium]
MSIWAVTLFYVFSNLPASTISSSADSIPLSDILQTPQANGDPSSAVDSPSPIATPVTQPVIRQPGPLVAAGDLSALASAFEVDSAMDHINTLASPRYAGRYVGSPGGFAAGDYIAQQFAEYGLQPAGDNGTFYQSFPIPYTKLSQIPTLAVISPDGVQQTVYTLHQDFSVIVNSYLGTGLAEGEVVWANNCDASDFYGLDVVGKILLCRNGSSVNAGRNAVEHGASGLLLLINSPTFPFDFGSTYQDNWVPSTIPALRVSSKVAESILRGSGKQVSDLSITFSSFELNTRVRIEVSASTIDACPDQICQGRNILGVMPGSDPLYAGDVLIIGGHYDHLGDTPDQSLLWAGANDNASGIAVLLEIARVWQAQGYVPRRTVLFAAWDAEELGLIGSTYYVANPVYPLTSTLGMLQLDMVGAGGDTLNIDGIAGLEQQVSSAAESLGIPFELTNFGRSDHVPFLQAGVPASLLIWYTDDDALPEYHRPIDTPSTIDPDKLMQVGQVAAITLLSMADGEPQLDDMLYRRAQAVLQSDLTSFLQTSAPGQEGFDRLWFEDILTFSPISIDIQASAVNVNGHNATALVDFTLEYPNPAPSEESQDPPNPTTTKTFSLEAKFIRTESGWLWAGPNLSPPPELSPPDGTLPSPPSRSLRFDVYSHPQVFEDITGLGELAAARYRTFAKLLGLPEDPHAALYLYPSSEALRADTLLSLLPGTPSWIAPGVIKMVYSDQIMEDGYLDLALSQLLLAQAGLTAGAA